MTHHPAGISVTRPVGPALDRVKRLLFQPFDLGKWFVIGFCAWLADLGRGGVGGNYNFGAPGRGRGFRDAIDEARDYMLSNLHWIVPLAVALVVLGLTLWIIFVWLSSRGRFMFLHCVALDKAEVVVPWNRFARQSNSLCQFRLVLGLIGILLVLPLLALAGVWVLAMLERGGPGAREIIRLIGLMLGLVSLGTLFAVVGKLTTDFVVPIQFLRGGRCGEGWRELLGLFGANPGRFVLYLLFQILVTLAEVVMVGFLVVGTCCVAGCLIVIPYVGTVVLLPIRVFDRAYSLHYLAQYGRDFDVWAGSSASTSSSAPTPAAG